MPDFDSIEKLVKLAEKNGQHIYDIVLEDQSKELNKSKNELLVQMREQLKVMREAISSGEQSTQKSPSGLSGGAAFKMRETLRQGRSLSGNVLAGAISRALAIAEVNACMGRIVAAPTAGSCGIIPAVLVTLMEEKNIPEDKTVLSLFTAAGMGIVIAKRASISGAEGGCQAECGSASAMAAAAAVEMMGGTPQMAADACAMALKNVLGLVCDPVAGLVEIPCIKRNAGGAANALTAAEMALAGITSAIPADEVIDAMKSVGGMMPKSLKETADAGLASTQTAQRVSENLLKK